MLYHHIHVAEPISMAEKRHAHRSCEVSAIKISANWLALNGASVALQPPSWYSKTVIAMRCHNRCSYYDPYYEDYVRKIQFHCLATGSVFVSALVWIAS